ANADIELRNRVIHQGYFPTKDECLKYGSAVLDSIRQTIQVLYDSKKHKGHLIRSINEQGDFSSSGPNYHYYAYPLIGTNRPPSDDTKTLDEMLAYVVQMRQRA